jgi:hypothetical protein
MVEVGCGACGTPLVAIASTVGAMGPYPTEFLTCRHCGAAWEQSSLGIVAKRRSTLTAV